jgi:hypothetical protein
LYGSAGFFEFFSVTFRFRARDSFAFPAFLTGNVFRGALGSFLRSANPSAYHVLFGSAEPDGTTPPRPFALRCRNLDGGNYSTGEIFSVQLNLFLPNLELLASLTAAFTAMGDSGFGPTRSRAALMSGPDHIRHVIRLDEPFEQAREIKVHFQTPTELKSNGEVGAPGSFSVLFARAYERLYRLTTRYGFGNVAVSRKAFREQAGSVVLRSANLQPVEVSRRGTRLGQTHPVGGFIGFVQYSGDLGPFLPVLRAASFTGIGRHTVWGNGEISTEKLG